MKAFFRIYGQMLENKPSDCFVRRGLMDEIDPGKRLVCIRGERGIGKTRFLLDYAEEKCAGKKCLYASLNYFYFSVSTLYAFAADFVREEGGEVLLLDQIYKYPHWEKELREIHRDFTELRIIFTTSSVMTESSDFGLLGGEVAVYELKGFSFREYLNLRRGLHLEPFTLSEILDTPKECISKVRQAVSPYEDLGGYLYGGGYYPSAADPEKGDTSRSEDELIKHLNMLLEVDVVYIRQIGPGYLPKLRKLLYTIASTTDTPKQNISRLSDELGISRATVMNYLHYLSDAGLIYPVYKSEEAEGTKKPDGIFIGNPGILSALTLESSDDQMARISFLLSHLRGIGATVTADASVKGTSAFVLGGQKTLLFENAELRKPDASPDTCIVTDKAGMTGEGEIPLWLFGFLY